MAEADPLDAYEAELDLDFIELRKRIKTGFRLLDMMAHVGGSPHKEREVLCISRPVNDVLEGVHLESLSSGLVVASTHDPEGWTTSYYKIDISRPGPLVPEDTKTQIPLASPNLDQMLVMASLVEECNSVVTIGQAMIRAYEP